MIAGGGLWSSLSLKEAVQNAVVVSKAVYADTDLTCEKYLTESLSDHNLTAVARSRNGKCRFVIAEEAGRQSGGSNRLYIGFRGTASTDDWKDNLRAFQEDGAAAMKIIRGRFHSGFLSRAVAFPADKILNDEAYRNRDIVVCGHSLGGAVATIVAVVLMLEVERRRKAGADDGRNVACVTFGAPLVGDADLRTFCETNGLAGNLFHFVSDQDPVPRLLSYAHSLSALSAQLDNQVRSLTTAFSTPEAASFYEHRRVQWIADKDRYVQVRYFTESVESQLGKF